VRSAGHDVEADAVGDRLAASVADEHVEEDGLDLLRRRPADPERRVLPLRDVPAGPGDRLAGARLRPAGLRLGVVELEVGRDPKRDVVDAEPVVLVRHRERQVDELAFPDGGRVEREVREGRRREREERDSATDPDGGR
jgi:hypothetical protein